MTDEEKHKKFDVIIGNPPYQEESHGEQKLFTAPIYDKFMNSAYQVGDIVELITPARFLFNAGSTPKAWNKAMLNDSHLRVVDYYGDSSKVFNNVDIAAGVAVTLRNTNKNFGAIEVFTPYNELNSIRQKISNIVAKDNMSEHIYNQNKFDLDAMYQDHPEYKNVIGSDGRDKRFRTNIFQKINAFTDNNTDDALKVIGLVDNKRTYKYINKKYVDMSHPEISTYKVMVPKTNGTGKFGEPLINPFIEIPNVGFTQTFIGVGTFDDKQEAMNCLKYIKSKFLRVTLDILKVTQDTTKAKWRFVPWQDFSPSSDIDWTKSISEIDQQLYKKYNLSQDEINFVETNMKEMD